jgi:hypothetical protein
MHARRFQSLVWRHPGWLLWLALLLPLAQSAATWHVLSHSVAAQVEDNSGPKAIGQDPCDLCLSAAAVLGGATRLATSPWFLAGGLIQAPFGAPPERPAPAPAHVYQSRAPPLFQP